MDLNYFEFVANLAYLGVDVFKLQEACAADKEKQKEQLNKTEITRYVNEKLNSSIEYALRPEIDKLNLEINRICERQKRKFIELPKNERERESEKKLKRLPSFQTPVLENPIPQLKIVDSVEGSGFTSHMPWDEDQCIFVQNFMKNRKKTLSVRATAQAILEEAKRKKHPKLMLRNLGSIESHLSVNTTLEINGKNCHQVWTECYSKKKTPYYTDRD